MERSDKELLQAAQRGSLFAFEELVRRYQGKILSFVRKILKDDQEAQDVTQEAFVSIYKTIDRIDPDGKFSTYLFEIAKNGAISALRKSLRQRSLTEEIEDKSESPEEILDRQFTRTHIQKKLAQLHEKYRRVLQLYYFQSMDYKEISSELNMPLNTVRTLLRRAKLIMKEKLND